MSPTVTVGSNSQGSKTAFGERLTQAPRMPADMAPMTSNGLPETSHDSAPIASAWRRKWA